jgi:hypothetical protein
VHFVLHPHRMADTALPHLQEWAELQQVLGGITDDDVIERFHYRNSQRSTRRSKSISEALNQLIDTRLAARGWDRQAPIFNDPDFLAAMWKLDFAKGDISVEVAFNHGEACAWNLLKPVLASETNHVQKGRQTRVGVIVTVTEAMKDAGGFDGAVASFEKFIRYLVPLQAALTTPLMLVGLEAPVSFRIRHRDVNGRKEGEVVPLLGRQL